MVYKSVNMVNKMAITVNGSAIVYDSIIAYNSVTDNNQILLSYNTAIIIQHAKSPMV